VYIRFPQAQPDKKIQFILVSLSQSKADLVCTSGFHKLNPTKKFSLYLSA
jgi:hypothetical protein